MNKNPVTALTVFQQALELVELVLTFERGVALREPDIILTDAVQQLSHQCSLDVVSL